MIKRQVLLLLAMTIILLSGGQAAAEQCQDITGDWGGNFEGVFYTPESGYRFEQIEIIFHIIEQQGCLFYGSLESQDGPLLGADCPLVGLIDKRKISMSICGAIIRGTLWGNNKMMLTLEDIALDSSDMQSAGKGIVVKLDN